MNNNILLISHDGFASGAKKATELILGEQQNIYTLELTANMGIDNFKHELNQIITKLTDENHYLVILSDLKNGTPYNCALSIIASHSLWNQVCLFSGMNLNLILDVAVSNDEKPHEQRVREMIHSARSSIIEMNKTIWDSQLNVEEE